MKFTLLQFSAKIALGTAALLTLGILAPSKSLAMTMVDSELYLSVDVSGSVSTAEFDLQKNGYANAFRDSSIQSLITSAQNGISVAYGYWSGLNQQETTITSTLLKTNQQINDFADLIAATTRPFNGNTGIGDAISFAAAELLNNQFDGKRLVIDVSGDGTRNTGSQPSDARDAAVAAGITINGLPIGNAFLESYYQTNVQGGDGSFTILANSFEDFDSAVQQKLFKEISGGNNGAADVPTPALLPGLIGIGAAALRKRKGNEEPVEA